MTIATQFGKAPLGGASHFFRRITHTQTTQMDHKSASSDLLRQLFNVALLLTCTTMWMVLGMALVRSGLGDSTWLQISAVVFLLLSIWLPLYAISMRGEHGEESSAVASTLGILFPLLGYIAGKVAVWVAVCLLGFVAFRLLARRPTHGPPVFWKTLMWSLALATALLSLGTAGRFFLPEEISIGSAHSDSYFHIALASTIAKFQLPSIGADGLALTQYHFGSHFVAGGIANATGARASEVYVYWGGIVLRIQLIWGLLWFNLHMLSTSATPAPVRARIMLLIAFIGLAAPFFDSESFLMAMAIFFGTAPLISRYLTVSHASDLQSWKQFSIILVTAFICAATKVSVGYFIAAILIYASYKDFKNTKRVLAAFAGLLTLSLCTVIWLNPDGNLLNAGFRILLVSYLQYATPTTLMSFLFPIALLLLHFAKVDRVSKTESSREGTLSVQASYQRWSNIPELLRMLSSLRGEWQLLCVSLVACVLVVVTLPIGSNAAYFSGVLLFMSFAMAPAWYFQLIGALQGYRLFKLVELVFLTMLGVHLLTFALQFKAKSELVVACETCTPSADNVPPRQQVLNSLRTQGTVWSTTQARLTTGSWATMIREVEGFAASRPGAMVFVPPAHTAFWKRLQPSSPYWCISPQLMIPAQTGIPMLRGIAPSEYEPQCMPPGLLWYGFGHKQDAHRTGDFSDERLCEMAVAGGFNRIYVLNAIDDLAQNRKLSCT